MARAGDDYEDDFEPETSAPAAAPVAAASASAVAAPAPAGTPADYEDITIDQLEIGKKLGGGGFAVVFVAKFRGKTVAAKVLVDPKISDALRKEFMDELRVMRSLRHPNIVRCVAACTAPPRMAFVMEMCGDSLFSILHTPAACRWRGARDALPLRQTVKWARGVAEAVLFLHSQSPRVVHRDLKSHNLLLAQDGSLKLCDFGLVHHPDAGAGTPQYMAPELLAGGKGGFTDRVDVFAFGVLLWEMLARKVPYAGWRVESIVEEVQAGVRPPIAAVPRDAALRSLLERCWHAEPARRPPMADVVAALSAWKPTSSAVASASRKRGGDALDALLG